MAPQYMDVEKVGDLILNENLVADFIGLLDGMDLPKTHDLGEESGEDNPKYNKYIPINQLLTPPSTNSESNIGPNQLALL